MKKQGRRIQGGSLPEEDHKKIDVHAHSFPEEFILKLKEHYPEEVVLRKNDRGRLVAIWSGTPLPAWNHRQRIEEMSKAGVGMGIISNPLMYIRVDEHSPELCRLVNDAFAATCRENPECFKAFANIPFNSVEASMAELKRVVALPGFVGVLVTSNVGGKYLHTPDFLPFWEEVDRHRLPVYMHPQPPPGYQDEEIAPLLAFPADTTLSTMKLLYSGLLERFPDLILILSHFGGSLPFLARRIDLAFEDAHFPEKYRQIPSKPSDYMRKLYLDTALGWYKPAFECARALVGIDHIVYGSDYFMENSALMDRTNTFFDELEIPKEDKQKIYHKNTKRLFSL